jgi:hypothetical protein
LPPPRAKHRSKTPEILLAPHYLESSGLYYGWEHERSPVYRLSDDEPIERCVSVFLCFTSVRFMSTNSSLMSHFL